MSVTRREFLGCSAINAAAVAIPASRCLGSSISRPTSAPKACIVIHLTGGPSQLDTFDPKPSAPSDVRGPFATIRTSVPGVYLSELFPRLATIAHQFSIIRTLHHDRAPIHELGIQLLNRHAHGITLPSHRVEFGLDASCDFPANCDSTHGYDLVANARRAVELVERGATYISINSFGTVFDSPGWDCHADRGALRTSLADYRTIAPQLDAAFTTLISELHDRGRLAETLVVAVGEFGRTPKLNRNGGRDHWANCWSALVAGGGTVGGRVVGTSDAIGGEPKDRPVHLSDLANLFIGQPIRELQ